MSSDQSGQTVKQQDAGNVRQAHRDPVGGELLLVGVVRLEPYPDSPRRGADEKRDDEGEDLSSRVKIEATAHPGGGLPTEVMRRPARQRYRQCCKGEPGQCDEEHRIEMNPQSAPEAQPDATKTRVV